MSGAHSFTLAGEHLLALPSGALFWPGRDLLCASDLHLGKSERAARRLGVMLPPYETRATLDRLAQDLAATAPATVVALGDSFDDLAAADALDAGDRAALAALMEGRRWVWVEGNHDPGATAQGGEHVAELALGPLAFRHEARAGAAGEVSGHWHPKAGLPGWAERRPCFVIDAARVLLPAYGAYTGGLDARRPPVRALFGARAVAVLTGRRALPSPLSPLALRRRS
jgi:DNA ligase-associated metallophosphoesterase